MQALALVSDAFGGHGGIGLYNRNLLSALCEYGGRSDVVALPRMIMREVGELPNGLDFKVEAHGSKLTYCRVFAETLWKRRAFDLIVAAHVHLLPLAEIAKRITGAPILLFIYGIDAWKPKDQLTRLAVQRVDRIVSIRQHTIDRLASWARIDGIPRQVLENAIDIGGYQDRPPRPDLQRRFGLTGRRVLMTLGRIEDERFGFDEVIDVLPDLLAEMPDLAYLVAGDGDHVPRLRDKAERLGVSDRVIFTGMVPEDEKADYYRLADAFAMPGSHPTDYDRYPLRFVFLEAMACGLPVVASLPEELRDPADSPLPNIYVDPNDREDLRRGLRIALERGRGPVPPELYQYDYPTFAQRLHSILDDMLAH